MKSKSLERRQGKPHRAKREVKLQSSSCSENAAGPMGASELEWSFRLVPTWTKMTRPLYSHTDQSLDMEDACPSARWLSTVKAIFRRAES